MMKRFRTLATALVISALITGLAGCQKQEGPAQKAGKEVDKAVGKVGQALQEAGDSLQDASKGDKK